MAQNNLTPEQARGLIQQEFGVYGLWDELNKLAEEFAKRTSAFSKAIIAGSMEDNIELIVSVETGLTKVMAVADILQLSASQQVNNAVWNEYVSRAVALQNNKVMPESREEEGE